jgi:hypothetical protein
MSPARWLAAASRPGEFGYKLEDRNSGRLPLTYSSVAMSLSSSILPPATARGAIRLTWAQDLGVRPRGLALAREKGWILAWDEKDRLHLFDRKGARQAQKHIPPMLTATCADDASAYAATGSRGQVWWLAPDLTVRWEQTLAHRLVTAALDPFGQYLALADGHGNVYVLDRHGRPVSQFQSQRPLHHLAFVPAAPFLIGSADYGLVTCFELTGRCVWRDGLVAHIGSLAVSSDGSQIMLACFTEGVQRYNLAGKNKGRLHLSEPCRLVTLSFAGSLLLVAGLSHRILLHDRKGRVLCDHELSKPAVGLALTALGDRAVAALADGRLVGLDLREASAVP